MIFKNSFLNGAFLIIPERHEDDRGFFARSFCVEEFAANGIDFLCKQCNYSYNKKRGTLRGMHYQKEPYMESKIASCISGSVFDVIIDLRVDSQTFLQWEGFELSEENHWSVYVPMGFAHGFMTLEDETCMFYQMGELYHEGYEGGIRYDDPTIGIKWPHIDDLIMSERDRSYPDLII